ncbi:UNVERIFIED_CONTAM: Ribosomal lysine N-methyltransferase 3 [Sesamum latifolium]|uniref:Ribosomal lysine N-methyltransferase 3 n=1 Tax=Sesamum latifolium TaxID=2727402 RepID=A0AAW2VG33_9LAMI
MAAASDRRMRGFNRWMKYHGIECSDALLLSAENGGSDDSSLSLSISVKALCDLKEGDVVATIPKQSCLTVRTSAASRLIEEAQLGGNLGLTVALMYDKSLGPQSKWFQYLQILPPFEPIPLLWSLSEIDSLLTGTELHKIVKEDKALVYQDWKECIKPLLDLDSFQLNPEFFTADEYIAAKSLVASRSFQVDEYHGSGMVPLADLFNHKTAAEDVHLTSVSSSSESDAESGNGKRDADDENDGDDEPISPHLETEFSGGSDLELSSNSGNESTYLEMIIVRDVKAGTENLIIHLYSEPRSRYCRTVEFISVFMSSQQKKAVSLEKERSKRLQASACWERRGFCLTRDVCQALFSLADARESLYGPNSLDDDIKSFTESSHITDPKLYHSLTLRISERRIIERLRSFAASGAGILRTAVGTRKRRRVERT